MPYHSLKCSAFSNGVNDWKLVVSFQGEAVNNRSSYVRMTASRVSRIDASQVSIQKMMEEDDGIDTHTQSIGASNGPFFRLFVLRKMNRK